MCVMTIVRIIGTVDTSSIDISVIQNMVFDHHHLFSLRWTIDFVSATDQYGWKGYVLAVSLLVVNVLKTVTDQLAIKYGSIVGMRIRTAVITSVYRKVSETIHCWKNTCYRLNRIKHSCCLSMSHGRIHVHV